MFIIKYIGQKCDVNADKIIKISYSKVTKTFNFVLYITY